jgi:phosphate transport system substrate-binding protein
MSEKTMMRVRHLFSISLIFILLIINIPVGATSVELLGAGATFPYPLYSKMFYEYWRETGIKVNYQAIGSGGGQRQLINMTVDFGGSDAFMSDDALKEAPAEIIHIPTCLGAVVIAYNLPGDPELKFTPGLIADIFLGRVTQWNDQRILDINPDENLPEMDIVVVHRSDGSGTTFVFTDYLSKVSIQWEKKLGRGKAVNWHLALVAKGNPGVADMIKIFPGSIGYLELGYALLNEMPVAILQNRAGRFIKPDTTSTSLAANVALPEDTRISITNTEAPDGYPISSFTWILVFKDQSYKKRPEGKARELAKLLLWMVDEAQKYMEPLHYAPLSEEATKKARERIKSITYNGRPVLK